MSEIPLKGKVIGFEEYDDFVLQDIFGEASPFRLLACINNPITFVVVNPFYILDDYTFELEDDVLKGLHMNTNAVESIAILCVVRPDENTFYVNLRSPLIINTLEGSFTQTILQNETYGVSVPFILKKTENSEEV